jgi:hypothetical protein
VAVISGGVLPFCRASNSLLSATKCIGMLLGPEAANPPVGPEGAASLAQGCTSCSLGLSQRAIWAQILI